ncbi:MAG: sugar phosphate isomerase/epimerase [Chitinophagaceae bacterium]|nr:sugar phosphate isomerase/epimerase [Chitinophagaceae bacterium]
MHNIIRGDSTYNTFEKQVALVKNAGYDGIEINSTAHFEGMKAALDKHRFQASYFYVRISLQKPFMDESLEGYIRQLQGSKTIIAPYIVSDSIFRAGTHEADSLVIRLMRQLSDWAEASALQVAIYPHLNYYVERTDHALALARSIDRKNLGLSFNLCHWLATTVNAERKDLQPHLHSLLPYLKMITICGANNTVSQKKNVWDDYILPLGTGDFDTYELIKYCLKDLKLKVPVGVQCYNIKTDKYQLVQNSIQVWKQYLQQLENEK